MGGQLLRPTDKPDRRVIVGTWRTRKDWEGWHQDPQFAETRRRLDGFGLNQPSTGGMRSSWMCGKPQRLLAAGIETSNTSAVEGHPQENPKALGPDDLAFHPAGEIR